MKYLAMLSAVILLSGCLNTGIKDWKRSTIEYICSDVEHKKVEREAVFCTLNTGYVSTYCYGAAMIRNCKKREQGNE